VAATTPSGDLDILVLGEINPDVVVADPDPTPAFGQVERIVGSITMTVGSSSAIFACGAARLGLAVGFVGVVGDDPFGRFMLDAMAARGIDVSGCRIDPSRPTGASVILTTGDDRAILTSVGTIGALDVDDVPRGLLERARHLHSGSFFLQETSRERLPAFFAAARARGQTTSFDANWDPAEHWDGGVRDMLRASDVFFPNAVEATRIAGIDSVEEATLELARIGSEGRTDGGPLIVVKLGADGALTHRCDVPIERVPALPVDAVDTTGAGDSFDAGFLRAWLDGASTIDALRLGAVCGALSTLGLGGVDAQPTRAEAERALAGWPVTAS
jgi:sugar/nucleoside kinase (ribokinase family)